MQLIRAVGRLIAWIAPLDAEANSLFVPDDGLCRPSRLMQTCDDDDRKLEPFRGVYRHQLHRIVRFGRGGLDFRIGVIDLFDERTEGRTLCFAALAENREKL